MKNIFTFLMLLTGLIFSQALLAHNDEPNPGIENLFSMVMDNLEITRGPCNSQTLSLFLNGNKMTNDECLYTIDPADVVSGMNEVVIEADPMLSVINGVSTLDLVLLYKGLTFGFEDNFQIIASDFDGDLVVSTKDIITLRRYILGIENTDILRNFRIVEEDYNFPADFSPYNLGADFRSFTFNDSDLGNGDLKVVVIKSGDLNDSAFFAPEDPHVSRDASVLSYQDVEFQAGDVRTINMEFNSNTNFQAATFELQGEGIEILSISDYGAELMFNNKSEEVSLSYFSDHPDDSFSFAVEVKATADGKLSEMLSLNSEFLKEVVDFDLNVGDISLSANGVSGSIEITDDLFTISPNPVAEVLNISFDKDLSASEILIELISLDGKTHHSYTTTGSQFSIDVTALETAGLHMVRVTKDGKTKVEKVMIY